MHRWRPPREDHLGGPGALYRGAPRGGSRPSRVASVPAALGSTWHGDRGQRCPPCCARRGYAAAALSHSLLLCPAQPAIACNLGLPWARPPCSASTPKPPPPPSHTHLHSPCPSSYLFPLTRARDAHPLPCRRGVSAASEPHSSLPPSLCCIEVRCVTRLGRPSRTRLAHAPIGMELHMWCTCGFYEYTLFAYYTL